MLREGRMTRTMITWGLLVLVLLPASHAQAGPVRFRNDVMAVLSRAGCNQGACHGNQNGKNGFKLSLRGQDPEFDFGVLTRGTLGRRANLLSPRDSLLLLKPTAAVPHEGGKRFAAGSPEYRLVAGWIAQGMRDDPPATPALTRLEVTPVEKVIVAPTDRVRLRVRAHF